MNGMQARPGLVQLIAERQEFIQVLESHLNANNQAEAKRNPGEHSTHSGEQLLSLQDSCPRFGVPVANQTTKYKIIQKPHEFLAEFHMHACNYLGRNFQTQCRRLLLQAILDRVKSTQVSDALDYADKNNDPKTNGLGKPRSNWELCESSFIEKTTTENERRLEIEEQLKAGQHRGEKYADYASRMHYMFRVYKIDDRDSSTLGCIHLTVFAWVCTFINDAFRQDSPGCGQ